MCCVLSSALPAEAVFNPYNSMPCCHGMGGECHGNSCPLHRRARAKPTESLDEHCGSGHTLQAKEETSAAPQAHSQHAHSHDQTHVGVEHDYAASVSPQNISQTSSRQPSAGVASLMRPCPSDCCGATAGSFPGLRRQRHDAALAYVLRPRPPTVKPLSYARYGINKAASSVRRSHPPRAPPTAPDNRTA